MSNHAPSLTAMTQGCWPAARVSDFAPGLPIGAHIGIAHMSEAQGRILIFSRNFVLVKPYRFGLEGFDQTPSKR